jgi:hypothetical protein
MAVEVFGLRGVEWEKLTRSDMKAHFKIKVEGGNQQALEDQRKKEAQQNALAQITADQGLRAAVNNNWFLEQVLKNGEFDEESVRVAMDVQNFATQDILSEAALAIDDIINGKVPALYLGANTAFQEKVERYAYENTDGDMDLFNALIAYSEAHDEIVQENMRRSAKDQALAQQLAGPESGLTPESTGTANSIPSPVQTQQVA